MQSNILFPSYDPKRNYFQLSELQSLQNNQYLSSALFHSIIKGNFKKLTFLDWFYAIVCIWM